jgi:hypothetical protein
MDENLWMLHNEWKMTWWMKSWGKKLHHGWNFRENDYTMDENLTRMMKIWKRSGDIFIYWATSQKFKALQLPWMCYRDP